MMIRAIVELPAEAVENYDPMSDYADGLTDALIEVFDTPEVAVLDVVAESETSAWARSSAF